MTTETFKAIAPRPAPVRTEGLGPWLKRNLFSNVPSSITTIVLLGAAAWYLPQLLNWALLKAVFAANHEQCQAVRGTGACWGVVTEKYRIILFGRYPFEDQWRPLIATIAMVATLVASCVRIFWKPWLVLLWLAMLVLFFALMFGGFCRPGLRAHRALGRPAADGAAGHAVDRAGLPAGGGGGAGPGAATCRRSRRCAWSMSS